MKPIEQEALDQVLHVLMGYVFTVAGTWWLAAFLMVERERCQHGWEFWEWKSGAQRDLIFGAIGIGLGLL